jgi:hypothetical protein
MAALWLAGCAPRADIAPDPAALASDNVVPVYVGTTRARTSDGLWSAALLRKSADCRGSPYPDRLIQRLL